MSSSLFRTSLRIIIPETDRTLSVVAYSLQRIGLTTPPYAPGSDVYSLFRGFQLADPRFTVPRGIDVVIGANAYASVLRPGIITRGNLVAQRTAFGWTITGACDGPGALAPSSSPVLWSATERCDCEELVKLLRQFWAVEEIPRVVRVSPDDAACEDCYSKLHTRNVSGQYIVPLPTKAGSTSLIGESLTRAQQALRSSHKRMKNDPSLDEHYKNFMREYLQLGHMRLVTPEEMTLHHQRISYIPHHAIWQRSDGGRKIRVVFNASSPTSTGYSLNDTLLPGPKLQSDIVTVLTRWRRHRVAFCADIKMMYRQVLVRPEDVHLQRIVWSESEAEPEAHYVLLTVTYGEACAPYLALRTLIQLCVDEGSLFPDAVDAIHNDIYVDDFLTGADNEESARIRRDQLIQLLKAGGFILKKWVSNTPELLRDLPSNDLLRPSWLHFTTDGPVNELGIAWDPSADEFHFTPPAFDEARTLTKRRIVAETARLFDPAGWLAPVILKAKTFIQDLWRAKLSWDDELPPRTARRWITFRTNLAEISQITLPRWIHYAPNSELQLHVFADASQRALAAVVFARVTTNGSVHVSLLRAKTKLAPIKSLVPSEGPSTRMTIPRMELRAALLAVRLLESTVSGLKLTDVRSFLWSDSSTVLHWLNSSEPVGNTLVDNYVHCIQESPLRGVWRYVPSNENPADVATRGAEPSQLKLNSMWWNGPHWLAQPPESWPAPCFHVDTPGDLRPPSTSPSLAANATLTMQGRDSKEKPAVFEHFSCLSRLLRALTMLQRLQLAFRARIRPTSEAPPRLSDPISSIERQNSFLDCVRLSQARYFSTEVSTLRRGHSLKASSPLRSLSVFLDDKGILRVGGRLRHSALTFEEKHPPVLDRRCHLTKLLIDWAHHRALHAGYRSTFSHVARRAWIVQGGATIKRRVRQCVVCVRASARTMTQSMADLPTPRVTPARPFSKTGVDYAGPFQVLRSKGRGAVSVKGYVAVFVCMCTKAIHLELVGDLTTASFLGALARFIGRRGNPKEIWSDNATNFHGADAELKRMLVEAQHDWALIANKLADDGIEWNFIPPSAPHFGGLWEAGVKSFKIHLRRVAGSRRLTFEEFSTLLVEIEMILNCRPISPLTGDLEDLDALTPAHFLVGSSLAALPAADTPENLDRLTHWELVRGMRDSLWRRWSREYLNTLQQRNK